MSPPFLRRAVGAHPFRRARPLPLIDHLARNASFSFQSLTHSSPFTIHSIHSISCLLHTLCEKHPGVGVGATFPEIEQELNHTESVCYREIRPKSFGIN